MPIEIRELIIKTEIRTAGESQQSVINEELGLFKKQLLEECKRLVQAQKKRNHHKR